MISISNAFRQLVDSNNTNYDVYVSITLQDSTVLTLDSSTIWFGGPNKEDTVSEDNIFSALGAAIINSLSVVINNMDESYSIYDFKNSKITFYIEQTIGTQIERVILGTYAVDEPKYNGATITLECLDNMEQFDRPFTTGLVYPTTLGAIVREACDRCGVTLATYNFPNYTYVVPTAPYGDAITFRDVISSVAQIAGCFARCDSRGRLELKWFDRSYLDTIIDSIDKKQFNPDTLDRTKAHYISSLYSQEFSVDDVVITGVNIEVKSETDTDTEIYEAGNSGYVISIQDNLFINSTNAQTILNNLATKLIGLRFRKCSVSHINNFTIEAGDIAVIKDRKNNYYPILVTRTNFSVHATQTTVCGAETPSRNTSKIYSKAAKNYVETGKLLNREKTAREIQYENLVKQISNTSGLYSTIENTQSGSIYYFHNRPSLQDSNVIWKMNAEAWAVSTNGGETWNAGMTVDGDTIVKILSATGINADWIDAGTFTVRDNDGNVIFQASNDTNTVYINGQTVVIGDTALPNQLTAISNSANNYTDDKLSAYAQTVEERFADVQSELDGKIETWFEDYDPTMSNLPASQWTTEELKQDHQGDLFLNRNTNTSYRFFKKNDVWGWYIVEDTQVSLALATAQNALNIANGKTQCFYNQPTPPYNLGDLWVQGANGDILKCVKARGTGESYLASDWALASKYTDDSAFHNFVNNDYSKTIESLSKQIDGKSATWYQPTDPRLDWSTVGANWVDHNLENILDQNNETIQLNYEAWLSEHEGDLWHNTSDNTEWILVSGEWEPLDVPDAVFDKIDGKAEIWGVQPVPPYNENDLWFTGTNILYCTHSRTESESFTQSDWIKKDYYTDDSALQTWITGDYKTTIDNLKSQIDGKAETWYQADDPSTVWITADLKNLHIGDLWYRTTDSTTWYWDGTKWDAQSIPTEVFDKLDKKAQIFATQPTTPYYQNDLYYTGTDVLVCVTQRLSGSYNAADWQKKDNYTDDSALTSFIAGEFTSLKNSNDSKIETWYQNTNPSTAWTTTEARNEHIGDLWYNTTNDVQRTYRWDGTQWNELTTNPPQNVFDTIDSKAQIFATQPVPPYYVNDIWFTNENILVCVRDNTSAFNASDWQKKDYYTDDSYTENFITNVYRQQIELLQNEIDGKIETWYQDTDPSVNWNEIETVEWVDHDNNPILDHNGNPISLIWNVSKAKHNGDYWHRTTDNTDWIYQDGNWREARVPNAVYDEIDGKAVIFTATPNPPYALNDLWFTGNEIKVCVYARESGSFVNADWEKKDFYTNDEVFEEWVANEFSQTLENIKTQIDGKAETWFQSKDPSENWTTTELKEAHVGDLWYNTTNSTTWYWDGTKWNQQDVPLAVFDEIDGKASVFSNQPVPPYYTNDLWFTGTNILVCINDRESGNFSQNDWQKKDFYTDDSALLEFIENSFAPLSSVVDGKINTYYQSTDPSKNWTAAQKSVNAGDLWYNTTTQKTNRWTGSAWEEMKATPPSKVFDTIDGKAVIFTGTKAPTNPSTGDLWFKGANEPILTYVNDAWTEYNKYTDDSSLNAFMNGTFKTTVQALQDADDAKAETWYQYNNPADAWTTSDLKNKHKGDIWYNTTASVQKYFIWTGTTWEEMKTVPPASVMDTIDGKAQIFTTTPSTPYEVGDVWFTGSVIRVCVKAKSTGSYTDSDWVKKDEYTDNSALNTFLTDTYAKDINQLQGLIDEKIDTYYRTSDPSTSWTSTEKSKHIGDIWYNSSTNVQKTYRWTGSGWEEMKATPPSEVFDAIDGKAQIFSSTPTPPYYVNDLWFTGNEIMVCIKQRLSGSFLASEWGKKDYYTDYHQMTPYETWQQLTDNGNKQGIEYSSTTGQLYINATYIHSGELDGDLIKANSISASKLNIGEGTNIYPNYDTALQITEDTLAWKKVGLDTTEQYSQCLFSSPIINGNYIRIRSDSSSTNHYMLLGNAQNYFGTVVVQSGVYYRISFYARRITAGAKVLPCVIRYSTRPSTTPSSIDMAWQSEFTLTTSWERYEFNYMPSSGYGYIALGFACPVASTTINICGIMIERLNTNNLSIAQAKSTSPFEPSSVTMIDGGNIMANTIKAKQIGVLGGWTIEENRMYHGNMALNGAGEKLEFNAYTNPHGNPTRNKAYIDNAGNCSFYGINGDFLQIGGEMLSQDAKLPSIYADNEGCGFYKTTSFNNSVDIRNAGQILVHTKSPFVGTLKFESYAAGAMFHLYVDDDGTVVRGTTPQSSSKRYKNPVRELTDEEGDLVYQLNPVWFKYKDEFLPEDSEIKGQALTGFYAEDILQIMPNVVYYNKEGLVENWKERELIPYLVKTIQNQKKKIDELESKLDKILELLQKGDK